MAENKINNADELLRQTGSMLPQDSPMIDSLTRLVGRGSDSSAIAAEYHGFNHRATGSNIPKNRDHYGYTFFTRPRLKLSYDNLTQDRTFALLNSKDEYSVARWVRATLDPVQRNGWKGSPLVDNDNAFIPLLSNRLETLDGWPDISVDTYTSKAGIRKEEWVMADGFAKLHGAFNINATFNNMIGSPITNLFYYWTQYSLLVHEGVFWPHLDSCFENEIDYQTRIYRMVMDTTNTYVVDIAACGVAFPLASQQAAQYDFSADKPFHDNSDTVSIPFQCVGAIYKDPILMAEFNATVATFNTGMNDTVRSKYHKQLSVSESELFNHFGYPWIDLGTGELQWWVKLSDYATITRYLKG